MLGLLDGELRDRFHRDKEIDFSFSWREQIRFRANVFRQQGTVALALRAIPFDIPTFDELGLPPIMEYFAGLPQGLLLVTGPTGSGKSTTQASVIDYINHTRECHILTIEDPIEYVHVHRRAAVNQREVGVDTDSFERALRSALREDPDVMLVGEMRDAETMQFALDDRRDRPPRVRDVAHQRRRHRARPHRRRVPGRPPGPDPGAARRRARAAW